MKVVTTTVETIEIFDTPNATATSAPKLFKRWSDSKRQYIWLHEMHPDHLWNVFKKETKVLSREDVFSSEYFREMLRLLREATQE